MSTRAFLDRLFAGCEGIVELRALPSRHRAWATVGEWRSLGGFVTAQVRAHQDVYVGVATRQTTEDGTAKNLLVLPAVYTDLDRPSPTLARFPFRPSIVVSSGRGKHLYWRLKEAADMRPAENVAHVAGILRRLARHLGGDAHATDVARILRLPGSLSFKHGSARPVALLEAHDTAIALAELDDFLPREVTYRGERVSEDCLREGGRNDTLYAIVRSLRFRGLPSTIAMRAIEGINADWCRPPLEHREVQVLLHKAYTAADAPDFAARHAYNSAGRPALREELSPKNAATPVRVRTGISHGVRNVLLFSGSALHRTSTQRTVPVQVPLPITSTGTGTYQTQIRVRTRAPPD